MSKYIFPSALIILDVCAAGVYLFNDDIKKSIYWYTNCCRNNVAYDVKHDFYDLNETVFNPVSVDIEVLKGCMRLVTMCITSDQMIVPQHTMDTLYGIVKPTLELPDDIEEVK